MTNAIRPCRFRTVLLTGLALAAVPSLATRGQQPPPASTKAATVPVVTGTQFTQALEIARLAADNGMAALSLRAVRDALRGGPPIEIATDEGLSVRRYVVGGAPAPEGEQAVAQHVEERLMGVVQQWKRHKFPAPDVYDALVGVVLPEARPAEVFLYPRPLAAGGVQQPRSVGRLLAQAAVQAGKADDLRRRVAARQGLPLAELPARMLLGVLGVEARDARATAEQLDWFAARVPKDGLQNTAELACHVAMPALHDPALSKAALPVVERAVKSLSVQSAEEPVGSLVLALARFHFGRKDVAAGRKQVQEYLRITEQQNIREGSDYGLFRRKQQLQTAALEFAKAGQPAEALDLLGQAADITGYRGVEAGSGGLLASLGRQLAAVPAARRYELLRAWTLPTATRKTVRLVGSFVPEDTPPPVFGKFEHAATRDPGVLSSPALLIEAARAAGQLDGLTAALEQAVAQKADNAEALLVLVQIARGQGAKVRPQLERLLAELPKKRTPQGQGRGSRAQKPVEWADYLVARACLGDRRLASLGGRMAGELLTQALQGQSPVFLTHLRRDVANAAVVPLTPDPSPPKRGRGEEPSSPLTPVLGGEGSGVRGKGGAPLAAGPDAGLALWHPASHVPSGTHQAGFAPPLWVGHDGMLSHLTGSGPDLLYFAYPLTGTFEFSLDTFVAGHCQCVLSYNGLVPEVFWTGGGNSSIWVVGSNERLPRANRYNRTDSFNRMTVQVQPGKVRYLANGHLIYEDTDPSPTSPWLALYTHRERHTLCRNLEFKGTPQIPREVVLVSGDRLEGWVSAFYGESRGPQRGLKRPLPEGPAAGPDDFDWMAHDGALRGRGADGVAAFDPIQSRLYYHRPLWDGETVRYEFLYEPDTVGVHPALDRLTFLLEPEGVRLHWMTDGDSDWTGLKPDNVAEEPQYRRGPSRLPLKPGEWNAVKLTLAGPEVVLELNGVEVYRRPLEPTNDRLFGFFHYKDKTVAQVRNVVLSGNWPRALTPAQLADLTARSDGKDGPADRAARVAAIGERFFAGDPLAVVRRARALPPAERYTYLLSWVVPNDDHKAFRLYGDFTPADGPPPLAPTPTTGFRVQTGGTLAAPALELVAVAKELNKLGELAERVQAVKAGGDLPRRGQTALLACVRIAQGQDENAVALLRQLQPLLAKLGPGAPRMNRWPELVAAAQGLTRPAVRPAALALLEHMVTKQIQPMTWQQQQALGPVWIQHVRHLRARGQLLARGAPPPDGQDPHLAHWTPVVQTTSASRGNGAPVAHWALQDGALIHYPGHHHDYAYFAVPLRGDFEVSCELTAFGWRETQLAYGARTFWLVHDLKRYDVYSFGRKIFDGLIQPQLAPVGDWYSYKLVVGNGQMTSYVNGRRLHEEPTPDDRDPWLMVHAGEYLNGGVRNLRITGRPTVPDRLELSKLPDLSGWLADYYEESVQAANVEEPPTRPAGRGQQQQPENPSWEKRGEEIYGRSVADAPGSKQESVLRYHRPLLEDGSLEYEFYYLPGKALTHPALDRLAFLLEPDGVRVHWLTDGKYERTGLAPDNAVAEKGNRRGPDKLPLKERDWNRMKVSLAGDTVTLALNGVVIYERPLEATNQRVFGLFHYADETEVRARNVIYRGNWPKQLPRPGDILAAPAVSARRP